MGPLEKAYVLRGGTNDNANEIARIWAYLDTLGSSVGKPTDPCDEALRVAVVALWRIRWEAEGVSKVGAPWLRDTTNAALEKLKAMGMET